MDAIAESGPSLGCGKSVCRLSAARLAFCFHMSDCFLSGEETITHILHGVLFAVLMGQRWTCT
jgi:hypothetical protein